MKIISTFNKFRPRFNSILGTSDVRWLSHHIPKTAGTSLRASFDEAFGRRQVYDLYNPTLVKDFSNGQRLDIPKRISLIHGHFQPHPNQTELYQNAKRIIWIRDPVARAWSVLKHLISVQKHKKEFLLLKESFGERVHTPDDEILDFFLKKNEFKHLNRPYQNYFKNVPIEDFAFVGVTERFDSDIKKLSELMEVKLKTKTLNAIPSKSVINKDDFKHYLKEEYFLVRNFIDYDSPQ
ncbi:hypothetical protein RJ41_05030 [Alteromonas marina]|uniref:Sulfotransferase family protein n=1 Tax=Alteromonas marina TaxID=203795 RepID=A0A0B3Z913_9ALTE|nr:sulfotransferase family 2 domain-containing protein [Alteromonas marina]KHT54951.1 hypothetical protein RJ41_05030 [Alteromonas marina]